MLACMALLKTIAVFILIGITVIALFPFGIILFLVGIIGFKAFSRYTVYKIAQVWAKMLIACTGCRLRVSGLENIPKTGGFCVASNHSGIFDIVLHLA
jgi:1-acyl-sn-glycerol-3-phosphate acyltransferase